MSLRGVSLSKDVQSGSQKPKRFDGFLLRQQMIDAAYRFFAAALKAGVFIFGLYQARLVVEALAGNETSVNIVLEWLRRGEGKVSFWLYVLAVVAILYGLAERSERRRKTEEMAERIRQLESLIDPKRTSSELLPDGRTNPMDG